LVYRVKDPLERDRAVVGLYRLYLDAPRPRQAVPWKDVGGVLQRFANDHIVPGLPGKRLCDGIDPVGNVTGEGYFVRRSVNQLGKKAPRRLDPLEHPGLVAPVEHTLFEILLRGALDRARDEPSSRHVEISPFLGSGILRPDRLYRAVHDC